MSKTNNTKKATQTISAPIFISRSGKGFVIHPDTDEKILIDSSHIGKALHRDLVEVNYSKSSLEGVVERVTERNKTEFVGSLEESGGMFYLTPINKKIHLDFVVPKEKLRGAENGDVVLARLDSWKDIPEASVKKIIGRAGVHETEMNAIVYDNGFDPDFSQEVLNEAADLKEKQKQMLEEAIKTRRDYRDVLTLTIDPDDAKDFDDAISFKETPDGDFEIGVHIADVSHYVTEKSKLDEAAIERGTSIYLVDRTIPMLPEVISNDLCSLNPNEDKLVFSAIFTFAKESLATGDIVITDKWIGETIIHSDRRFTYEEAQQVIETGTGDHAFPIQTLNAIAKKLARKNTQAGALGFGQKEVKFKLDENGHPVDVYTKEQKDSNHLVEQFMLLANKSVTEYVAETVDEEDRLFVYRIHDQPEAERLENLVGLLRNLGYAIKFENGTVSTQALNQIIDDAEETPEANMVQTAIIRSMAKAIYSTKNIGHFGLAFEHYTHFTSPIRRYPDVLVHRLLKKYLAGARIPKTQWDTYSRLMQQASTLEQSATDAERASIRMKQVEYLNDRRGQTFKGVISGVTDWGIYVQEETSRAEGLVRFNDLDGDYYVLDKKNMQVVGRNKKKKFRLGDSLCVKITKVDLEEQLIDLQPVPCEAQE